MEIEDYFLIRRIKAGDTDAWELLVGKYYDQIFSFCVRRCFGDRELASDLTQDIFLKVVENISSYSFTGKFFNYLFTIAVNHCNNHYVKKKIQAEELKDESKTSSAVSASEIVIRKEEQSSVQTALDQLPDIQKEAIILKYYHEMKVKEIAKVTKVSVPTAQSRIAQGLKKLNKYLDRKEFGYEAR